MTPIHHEWLEGNHKTPGRSPCRVSQGRMGVIWVDLGWWGETEGKKGCQWWSEADIWPPEWTREGTAFSTAPRLFIMIPKLCSSVLQSLACCLASLTCTHTPDINTGLSGCPCSQLVSGPNCMNAAEKPDYTSTSLQIPAALRAHWGSPLEAAAPLEATPHTSHR